MIKIEKRTELYCENCDDLQPCCMKFIDKRDDGGYDVKVVIFCKHNDICSHAINQYNNFTASMVKTTEGDK